MATDMSRRALRIPPREHPRRSLAASADHCRSLARIDVLEEVVLDMDGPDVEIRGYPVAVPLVMSPLIVANRDVFIAYDHPRWERPYAAIQMRSQSVINWATDYFDQLFLDAPFTLRNVHGPDRAQIDAFRQAVPG